MVAQQLGGSETRSWCRGEQLCRSMRTLLFGSQSVAFAQPESSMSSMMKSSHHTTADAALLPAKEAMEVTADERLSTWTAVRWIPRVLRLAPASRRRLSEVPPSQLGRPGGAEGAVHVGDAGIDIGHHSRKV